MTGFTNPKLLSANVSPLNWEIFTSSTDLFPIDGANIKPYPELKGVEIVI